MFLNVSFGVEIEKLFTKIRVLGHIYSYLFNILFVVCFINQFVLFFSSIFFLIKRMYVIPSIIFLIISLLFYYEVVKIGDAW